MNASIEIDLPELALVNLRTAGALLDVNELIKRGWSDLSGANERGEFFRYGSAWVEYVEDDGDREYHITLSLCSSLCGLNDQGTGYKATPATDMLSAHKGDLPRICFARRLACFVLDREKLSYTRYSGELPAKLIEKVEDDLKSANKEPARLLVADLDWQTEGTSELDGIAVTTDCDHKFAQLLSVCEKCYKAENEESLARLFAPFVRAVLTKDDPGGFEFLKRLTSVDVLKWTLPRLLSANYYEGIAAVSIVAINVQKAIEAFSVADWEAIAIACAKLNLVKNASIAVTHVLELADSEKAEDRQSVIEVFWAMLDWLKTGPKDAAGCRTYSGLIERCSEVVGRTARYGALACASRCYADCLENLPVEDSLKGFVPLVEDACRQFEDSYGKKAGEEKKSENPPWLSGLPFAVKAPFEWQAFICCQVGRAIDVIKAYPLNPFELNDMFPIHPLRRFVDGLSVRDIWSGFLPKCEGGMTFAERMDKWSEGLCVIPKEFPLELYDWLDPSNNGDYLKMLCPEHPESSELCSVGVQLTMRQSKKKVVAGLFPFLPKEHESNKSNVRIRPWFFNVWNEAIAADLEFTVGDRGSTLTAVMPYYIADRECILRGVEYDAKLAAFATALKIIEVPKLPPPVKVTDRHLGPVNLSFSPEMFDWFDQSRTFPKEISNAGYGLQGRVKSVRELKALGTDVLCVEVDCARLDFLDQPLAIYIRKERVEGGEIKVGDTIVTYGWLYIDSFDVVDNVDEFLKKYPKAAPEKPEDVSFGMMSYIRTECTEEDKANGLMPDTPDWVEYGKTALECGKDVSKVSVCARNPQYIHFLVRKGVEVLKYRLIVTENKDFSPNRIPGVETLVCKKERVKNGFELTWEGVP